MRRIPVLLALASLLPVTAWAGGGRPGPSVSVRGLPSGAVILTRVTIPGVTGAQAVVFRSLHPYLGVIESRQLVWKLKITAAPRRVIAPGPAGLFAAWVPSGTGARFYAFAVHGTRVASAIDGNHSGEMNATEGGSFSRNAVVLKNPDTDHVGSVRYRLVDRYVPCGRAFCLAQTTRAPDYPPAQYPRPNGVIHNGHGDTLLLQLEVANTEAERELGLMYRTSLDPDSGMLFVWDAATNDSFWMENTYIPLTVAFIASDGTILEMQDMAPQTTDYHTAHEPYQYAIEANQGYFARYGIQVGDKVSFDLSTG